MRGWTILWVQRKRLDDQGAVPDNCGAAGARETTMDSVWFVAWKTMRIVRWALWLGFIGYSLYFISNRAPHLTQFGHLKHSAEIFMFGLPLAAVFAGFMELALRGRLSEPMSHTGR
jgi:hypothetical protein